MRYAIKHPKQGTWWNGSRQHPHIGSWVSSTANATIFESEEDAVAFTLQLEDAIFPWKLVRVS